MTSPTVTEIRRTLEPVTRDTFIDQLSDCPRTHPSKKPGQCVSGSPLGQPVEGVSSSVGSIA